MRRNAILRRLVDAFAVTTLVALPATAEETKPNVVFILADNVGYSDLGLYGGDELCCAPTPRIAGIGPQRRPGAFSETLQPGETA